MFGPVSAEEMRTAQIITASAMALWLAVGYVPGLRARAGQARGVILGLYLLACAGAVGYLLLR